MRVAIVGGTGPFGRALAGRLRDAGFEVVIGSRDADRAAALAEELGVEGAANEHAARVADLVVLATNADAALETQQRGRIAGEGGALEVSRIGSPARRSRLGRSFGRLRRAG